MALPPLASGSMSFESQVAPLQVSMEGVGEPLRPNAAENSTPIMRRVCQAVAEVLGPLSQETSEPQVAAEWQIVKMSGEELCKVIPQSGDTIAEVKDFIERRLDNNIRVYKLLFGDRELEDLEVCVEMNIPANSVLTAVLCSGADAPPRQRRPQQPNSRRFCLDNPRFYLMHQSGVEESASIGGRETLYWNCCFNAWHCKWEDSWGHAPEDPNQCEIVGHCPGGGVMAAITCPCWVCMHGCLCICGNKMRTAAPCLHGHTYPHWRLPPLVWLEEDSEIFTWQ